MNAHPPPQHQSSPLQPGQWLKLSFFCPLLMLEAAADLLSAFSDAGVEQSPETPEGAWLSIFLPYDQDTGDEKKNWPQTLSQPVEEAVRELCLSFGLPPLQPELSIFADADWATSWRKYFHTFEVVPGLVIQPSWEEYSPNPGQHVLHMDPGMAFGTGQHASTRLALLLIRRCAAEKKPAKALDVGAGTGILAMAAACFGAESVVAIDEDPEAVRTARENATVNQLNNRIQVNDQPLALLSGSFDLICANIIHSVLYAMQPDLTRLLASDGRLILSGILVDGQEASLVRRYESGGLQLVERLADKEWSALLFAPTHRTYNT